MIFFEQFPNVRSGKFGSIICLIQSKIVGVEVEGIFNENFHPTQIRYSTEGNHKLLLTRHLSVFTQLAQFTVTQLYEMF